MAGRAVDLAQCATVGAVLVDPESSTKLCFGFQVGDDIVELWREKRTKQQVISQAELYPNVAARMWWSSRLAGRLILNFVDNDGAREMLVRGTSSSGASASLLSQFWSAESRNASWTWFDRVPSPSNIADGPSRCSFELAKKWGCKVEEVPVEVRRCALGDHKG